MRYYRTIIASVGGEVQALLEGGLLILFADGAPLELAEVSVLHRVEHVSARMPPVGSVLRIGETCAVVTAVGPVAWHKVSELGHVVITFNGASADERPGVICASTIDCAALYKGLQSGTVIEFADA